MPPDEVMTAEEVAITSAPQPDPTPAPEPAPPPADPVPAAVEPAAPETPVVVPAESEPKPEHMVPYGTLKEERERRQAAERVASEKYARLEGRLEELGRLFGGQKPAEPATPAPLPDPESNPVENLKALNLELAALKSQSAENTAAQARQADEVTKFNEFRAKYSQAADAFRAEAPDFDDAYKHFLAARDRTLTAAGWRDPAQRAAIMANEERAIVQRAMDDGENPAARIYAVSRDGFNYRKPEPAAALAAPGAPAAVAVPAAPVPALPSTEAQKLDAVRNGVDRGAKSLANGGGAPVTKMDLKTIANMTDDEFGRAVNDEQFKTIMKGFYATAPT